MPRRLNPPDTVSEFSYVMSKSFMDQIDPDVIVDLAHFFKTVSEKNRLQIIILLSEHSFCVNALAQRLKINVPSVSQHLRILRLEGLVRGEKNGLFIHYHLNREKFSQLSSQLHDLLERLAKKAQ
jgi:DNA-binding transcriptional ArsR family regulator